MKRKTIELEIPEGKRGFKLIKYKFDYKTIDYKDWNYSITNTKPIGSGGGGVIFDVELKVKKGEEEKEQKYVVKILKRMGEMMKPFFPHYPKESFEKEVKFAKFGQLMKQEAIVINVFDYGMLSNLPKEIGMKLYQSSPFGAYILSDMWDPEHDFYFFYALFINKSNGLGLID